MNRIRLGSVFALTLLSLAGVAPGQELVTNGDFEAGLTGWTIWSAPPGFWDATWIHSNDCDIFVPSPCPLAGTTSHAQKKGNDVNNAHGGLFQVLSVVPGSRYVVSGDWSGGASGNDPGGFAFWEIVVYDGAVGAAVIDQAPGPQDTLIAKEEVSGLALNQNFQFGWQSFSGEFTAQSSQVTLALKAGTAFQSFAASYHDNLSVVAVPPIPTLETWSLVLLVGALAVFGWRLLATTPV